jgi:hypothetical protein
MRKQAINFDDEIAKKIEDFRRNKEKIPSFNAAVVELIQMGLKHARR